MPNLHLEIAKESGINVFIKAGISVHIKQTKHIKYTILSSYTIRNCKNKQWLNQWVASLNSTERKKKETTKAKIFCQN